MKKIFKLILSGCEDGPLVPKPVDEEILVKWVQAPNVEAVLIFLGDLPLREPHKEIEKYDGTHYRDGLDVKLNAKGAVLSCSKRLIRACEKAPHNDAGRQAAILNFWRYQIKVQS